jgi:hypothetical protein
MSATSDMRGGPAAGVGSSVALIAVLELPMDCDCVRS